MTQHEIEQLIEMGGSLVQELIQCFKEAQREVIQSTGAPDIFSTAEFSLMTALWVSLLPRLSKMRQINPDGSEGDARDPIFEIVPSMLMIAFRAGAASAFDMKLGEKIHEFSAALGGDEELRRIITSTLMMNQTQGFVQETLNDRIQHFLNKEGNRE